MFSLKRKGKWLPAPRNALLRISKAIARKDRLLLLRKCSFQLLYTLCNFTRKSRVIYYLLYYCYYCGILFFLSLLSKVFPWDWDISSEDKYFRTFYASFKLYTISPTTTTFWILLTMLGSKWQNITRSNCAKQLISRIFGYIHSLTESQCLSYHLILGWCRHWGFFHRIILSLF